MFDCGEGTQRQLMKYSVGFNINHIFFTHVHADHVLGLPGLLSTFGLQDRKEDLHLYVPAGGQNIIYHLLELGFIRYLSFKIHVHILREEDQATFTTKWQVKTFKTKHRDNTSLGYVFEERTRPGTFYPEKAKELGIPAGPLWGRLQRGEKIFNNFRASNTQWIQPEDVMGPSRAGRKIVLTGDTAPIVYTVQAAKDADLLVHDCTFLHEHEDRAAKTLHTTAHDAGNVGMLASVKHLVLTHFSSKYHDMDAFLEEAALSFCSDSITLAQDGLKIEVPFRD